MTQQALGTSRLDATAGLWPDRRDSYPLVARNEARATASDFERKVHALVQERPVVSVLTAVGLGYLLARLLVPGMR